MFQSTAIKRYPSNIEIIVKIQAIVRGYIVRQRYKKHFKNEYQMISIAQLKFLKEEINCLNALNQSMVEKMVKIEQTQIEEQQNQKQQPRRRLRS